MDHLDIETVHRLLRGQLEPEEQIRWLRHTDGCQRCGDLLADERAMMATLSLGEDQPIEATLDIDALLDRTPALNPPGSARLRTALVRFAASTLLAIGLAGLLCYQIWHWPEDPAGLARELRISPETQERVVVDLSALSALRKDRWLVDQYETVAALESLIRGKDR